MRLKTYKKILSILLLLGYSLLTQAGNNTNPTGNKPNATIGISGNSTIATNDDTPVSPFAGITITSESTNIITLEISYSDETYGTLTLNENEIAADGSTDFSALGSSATEITDFLDNIVFTPTQNLVAVGTSTSTILTIKVIEDGAESTETITVNSTSVNDDPTITNSGSNTFTINDNSTETPFAGLTIDDVDANETFTVAIDYNVNNGSLGGSTTSRYTFNGSLTQVNTTLQNLEFDPAENRVAPGNTQETTFEVTVEDDNEGSASYNSISVISTSVNDATLITYSGSAASSINDTQTATPFANINIIDPDPVAITVNLYFNDDHGAVSSLGGFSGNGGFYSMTAEASTIETNLKAIVFTPELNDIAVGETRETTFYLITNTGVSNSQTTVTVTPVNDAPVLSGLATDPIAINDNEEDVDIFSSVEVTDPDRNASISVTTSISPSGSGTLNNVPSPFSGSPELIQTYLRSITFTPNENNFTLETAVTIKITLDDGAVIEPEEYSVIVEVTPINDAPSFTNQPLNSYPPLTEGENFTFEAEAEDADPGDVLEYSIDPELPPSYWLSFDPSTGIIDGTPEDGDDGIYTFTISVSDGEETVSQNPFTLIVTPNNTAPDFTVPNIITIEQGGSITVPISDIQVYTGNTNNDQNQTITSVSITSSNTTLVPNANLSHNYDVNNPTSGFTLDIQTAPNESGSAAIYVTITDDGSTNNTTTKSFIVEVNSNTDAPVITGQDSLSVSEDESITLLIDNIQFTYDGNSDNVSIATITAFENGNYTVNGNLISPIANFNGYLEVPVTIKDSEGNTSSVYQIDIKVLSVNDPPIITGQYDIEIDEDDSREVKINDLIVTDVDNTVDDFTLSASNGTGYTREGNTITPIENFFGTLTVPVIINDGSANSNTFNVTITVTPINDAPTISTISDVEVSDDAGQTLLINFGGVDAGPFEDDQNVVSVTAVSSNQALIRDSDINVFYSTNQESGQIELETIQFASGTAVITVTVQDDGGTANGGINFKTTTFTVTVIGKNTAPTLAFISDITLQEGDAPAPVSLQNIRDGDDGSQEITITATSSNTALIPNPTISYSQGDTRGTLIYKVNEGKTGSTTITVTVKDDGGTDNSGVDTYSDEFVITVVSVNDPPTVDAIADTTILEDTEELIIELTGITDGDADEVQGLTIEATSSRPEIIGDPEVNYTAGASTAQLILNPVANANGVSTTITVTITDDADDPEETTMTFRVYITPINDAPTISKINSTNSISIIEGADTYTQALSGITDGDTETELQSVVSVTASSKNQETFFDELRVEYRDGDTNGDLVFTLDPDINGQDTITITVMDNGGTDNGGINTTTMDIYIDVIPWNDPPTINTPANKEDILKNSEGGCITLNGITDGDPELDQNVTISASSSRPDIIPDPVISDFKPVDGTATLCYEIVPDARGTAIITLTLEDDGEGPGSNIKTTTFTLSVGLVNNAPIIIGEDGQALDELNLTTTKDVPLDICFSVIDEDQDEIELGEIIERNANASGEIDNSTFSFNGDSLCFVYDTYDDVLSGEDWFEFTICDGVVGDAACDTIRVNITILPSSELKIYNGISPGNPDGKNDEWFIEGIEYYPNNTVQIYSANGTMVFEANGYNNDDKVWKGDSNTGITLGSRQLPTGVYYYVINFGEGSIEPKKGSVFIR
ncbi:tandem-95 repeat protein [Chondrinema litorale]|uniref:tandem-95 repeat protein n=1 Tax=Chondrinema litorale TaxID=2994555 RepID=UPI002542D482|nr:tandem-95 repeat protein [Chondrinema litorale]UZR92640.1 Ig-like domain-containing protein [Chondrinema litorale]